MSQSYATLIKAAVGQGDGYLALSHSKDPKLNGLKTEFYQSSQVSEFMCAVEKYKNEQVYFGLGLRSHAIPDGKRGAREDISSISIIGMDIDIYDEKKPHKSLPKNYDEAVALLQSFAVPPSIIIERYWGSLLALLRQFWLHAFPRERVCGLARDALIARVILRPVKIFHFLVTSASKADVQDAESRSHLFIL